MEYAREYWRPVERFSEGFYTVDVPPGTDPRGVDENYRGNHARLVEVKNRFDPANLFRLNANVQPTV